ncbi:hypothetical protein Ahy_A07g035984 [Arachis hypogaea]|uniref:PB1-like domain-containing protein n=1 Tax=Arachis hypogaea TaxID=3818 RepID=A0A445CEX4_ARAHY|nr:hypothetical protein Ahy_A07g035984 [Arachis hypogaea]
MSLSCGSSVAVIVSSIRALFLSSSAIPTPLSLPSMPFLYRCCFVNNTGFSGLLIVWVLLFHFNVIVIIIQIADNLVDEFADLGNSGLCSDQCEQPLLCIFQSGEEPRAGNFCADVTAAPPRRPISSSFPLISAGDLVAYRATGTSHMELLAEMVTTTHITLIIHHRGRLERGSDGKLCYAEGEITEVERVNVDTLNGFFISDLLKDIGYPIISDFYWRQPGMEIEGGLRLLRLDMDVVKMYEAAVENGQKIELYKEHPISQADVVDTNEEADVQAPDQVNVTP